MLGTYALSAGYYDAFYLKAQKVRTLIKRDFDEVFGSGIDALVAPTSPSVAFRFGARTADPVAMYLSDACTLPANMAGIAGVSRPVRPVRGPAGRAAVHRPAVVRARAAALRSRLRGDHRRRRRGARLEPAQLALADDPAGPDAGGARRGARRLTGGRRRRSPASGGSLLAEVDPEVAELVAAEAERRATTIDLIASESEPSPPVLEALGSVFAAKTAEGYPGRRYHRGTRYADEVEQLAIDRAKALFGADHANVQPSSGVNANLAVYRAILKPGDTVLALQLAHGGHLSHGDRASITGAVYRLRPLRRPRRHRDDRPRRGPRPRAAASAAADRHRRQLVPAARSTTRASRRSPREVGARLLVDMAHVAGLVAAGELPSPVPHADAVTFTTYKTMLGPHGGVILARADLARPIDRAIFPGTQGAPDFGRIAAKAVCFGIAATPAFRATSSGGSSTNAQVLASALAAPRRPDRERRHGQPHGPGRPPRPRG